MKLPYCLFILVLFACSCKKTNPPVTIITDTTTIDTSANVYLPMRGADLTIFPIIESWSGLYFDSFSAKGCLPILQEHGCNIIRVGIWNHPADAHLDLGHILFLCQRINQAGMQIMLDFHYSDTAADAAHQALPAAWTGLGVEVLKDSVKAYTQYILNALKAQNTMPAIVQVGNDIDNGMLWPAGKVTGTADANWNNLAALVKSGIDGVHAVDENMPIMLHYGQTADAQSFFNSMQQHGVPFDIMGVSYYPWSDTKDLDVLQQRLNQLATSFNKQVFIAETAYPFSLAGYDNTPNIVTDNSQILYPIYQANQRGQLLFLQQLKKVIAAIPNNLGLGFSYQHPEWVPYRGRDATDCSPWENIALFDFYGMAQPGMNVYRP